MFRCTSAAVLTAILLASSLHAQMRGAGPAYNISLGSGRGAGFGTHPHSPGGLQRAPIFLGSPYFFADQYTPASPQAANPQIVVLQAAPAPEPVKEVPLRPLMIELQGGRYVRVGEKDSSQPGVSNEVTLATPPAQFAARELPPAILIFRDGHQEQVCDYTIAGGILYARGNYWSDGYWNKKILLSSLNLPASLSASEKNGVNFRLPASSNEVITRP